jgi:hypothetical protein
MKRIFVALIIVMAASAGFKPVFAQVEEPTIYVIKKGDTLWGLSDHFLKDPHYWPNLWANNPRISNPHLIFPGQRVKVYSDRIVLEDTSDVKPAAPALPSSTSEPLVAKVPVEEPMPEKTFLVPGGAGFLLEKDSQPTGYIISTYQDRHIVGEDDVVYTDIGKEKEAKVGDRFSIFRKMEEVSHPVSNFIMGYKVIPLGVLQLTEVEAKSSKAIIAKSFMEIGRGSYLMPYRDRKREVALKASTRELSGYIIDTQAGYQAIAAGDVAFLDLGSSQGLEVGNMLYIVRDVELDQLYVQGNIGKLPAEVIGALVVVEVGEKTATALIVKSIETVYIGDRVELKKSK